MPLTALKAEYDVETGMWKVRDTYSGRVEKYFPNEQEAKEYLCSKLNAALAEQGRF